jgi:hypothetical protein
LTTLERGMTSMRLAGVTDFQLTIAHARRSLNA